MTFDADGFTCLNEMDLFADLTPAEIEAMHMMVPERRFGPGDLIFSQSEPVSALFVLKSGRVRIFRVAEDGKALTLAILEPGAVFGEMLLVGQQMYENYAEAVEDSVICQLTVEDVERHLVADPRIALRIAKLLGDEVARLEERLTDLALRPLAARTAKTLLTLAESAPTNALSARLGHGSLIRITHEQLAGLLGATREATSKTVSDFAGKGLIRQSRGRITVRDSQRLRSIARTTS
ncbi:cyclic nucleotide-binding protein [Nesterenkonia sp. AN1]|uniref:Crp/Fnr family transcriptional regulator n=1 Tax=Nesterenkonia sp. AN1 TaxID=652017 RepID=UPI00044C0384|nr:Crp/Fnr family transcriptional regulator [Nesterenkonia sp. AN1]EXF23832.1 cyclic nucleotide-binding protein [Nesterenkonia sp. AN1]